MAQFICQSGLEVKRRLDATHVLFETVQDFDPFVQAVSNQYLQFTQSGVYNIHYSWNCKPIDGAGAGPTAFVGYLQTGASTSGSFSTLTYGTAYSYTEDLLAGTTVSSMVQIHAPQNVFVKFYVYIDPFTTGTYELIAQNGGVVVERAN